MSVYVPHKIVTTIGENAGVYWLVSLDDSECEVSEEALGHAYAVCSNYSHRKAGELPDEWHPSDVWLLMNGLCIADGEVRND